MAMTLRATLTAESSTIIATLMAWVRARTRVIIAMTSRVSMCVDSKL